ncbi:hypothetical protein [Klebsiella pneumoniae]|uniref:hypothetical protein n=1 Tax=Klebsiella pneumoniae TaxID=573 RepID=UPI0025A10D73|nr:hypothetical protein [Klebsiella pneumoniae]MDM7058277.1 hypothetical protein [Klebsiella pneumoniae]
MQENDTKDQQEPETQDFDFSAEFDSLINAREGANKQVISSQADSLIKISRIWADFFPANTSNQPI